MEMGDRLHERSLLVWMDWDESRSPFDATTAASHAGLNLITMGLKAMQKLLSLRGISEKAMSAQSAKAFITLIQTVKPAVFWEVGETIGAYSWLALKHSSTCRAILFEADPKNYSAILQTINRKQLHRAEANHLVVSTGSSGMSTHVEPAAVTVGAMSRGMPYGRETTMPVAVQRSDRAERDMSETLTLDGLLASGYASPDIIKLDTPDAAKLVMDGARQLLEACSPILIVKTSNHNLVRYLEGLSYRSVKFDQDNMIFISVYF